MQRFTILLALLTLPALALDGPVDASRPEPLTPRPTVLETPAEPAPARTDAGTGGGTAVAAAPALHSDTAAGEAGAAVTRPRHSLRWEAPTTPAPQIGYAPQAAQPLPGYPGFTTASTGQLGFPSATSNTGQLGSLFTDLKASRPGDVLTIVITQQAVAAANADKQSGRTVGLAFDGGSGLLSFLPSFGMDLQTSNQGTTNDTSGFNVETTFTVTIAELLPNGNLKVEGRQVVNMDGRDQWVKLTGEIRPYDVRPDNTIESTRVANVDIEFVGTRAQKPRKGLFDVIGGALESLFGILF